MNMNRNLMIRVRNAVMKMYEVESWADLSDEEDQRCRALAQDLYDIGILYEEGNLTLDLLMQICN